MVVAAVKLIKVILEKACPELIAALKTKRVTSKDAEKIVGQPRSIQRKAVALVIEGKSPTLAKAIGKIIVCKACQKIITAKQDPPEDRPECAELQKPKEKGKVKKSGSISFDDKVITDLMGKLIRAIDERGEVKGASAEYQRCVDTINKFEAAWRQRRAASNS